MVRLHLALVNERIFWHFIGILLATPFVRDQTNSFSVKKNHWAALSNRNAFYARTNSISRSSLIHLQSFETKNLFIRRGYVVYSFDLRFRFVCFLVKNRILLYTGYYVDLLVSINERIIYSQYFDHLYDAKTMNVSFHHLDDDCVSIDCVKNVIEHKKVEEKRIMGKDKIRENCGNLFTIYEFIAVYFLIEMYSFLV